jgi:hypothetical protein
MILSAQADARVAASVCRRAEELPPMDVICMEPTAKIPIKKMAMAIIISRTVKPHRSIIFDFSNDLIRKWLVFCKYIMYPG